MPLFLKGIEISPDRNDCHIQFGTEGFHRNGACLLNEGENLFIPSALLLSCPAWRGSFLRPRRSFTCYRHDPPIPKSAGSVPEIFLLSQEPLSKCTGS